MNGGQAIAFGQQGETFQNGRLGVMPTIEDGSDRFDNRLYHNQYSADSSRTRWDAQDLLAPLSSLHLLVLCS